MGDIKAGSVIKVAAALGTAIASNTDVQEMVLGKYSDGTIRSAADAIHGEYYSPKQKKKLEKRIEKRKLKNQCTDEKKKHKKKKKKKNKNKKKYYAF